MRKILQTNSKKNHQLGFTLLEIVVVLAIMGILISVAAVYMPSNKDSYILEQEVRRMQSGLRIASGNALNEGQEYGLFIEKDRYYFAYFNNKTGMWEDSGESSLKPYLTPDGLVIDIDSEMLVLPLEKYRAQTIRPNILFLSSGHSSKFNMNIKMGGNKLLSANIKGDGQSNFELESENGE